MVNFKSISSSIVANQTNLRLACLNLQLTCKSPQQKWMLFTERICAT